MTAPTCRGCSLTVRRDNAPALIVWRSILPTKAVTLAGFITVGLMTLPTVAKLTGPFPLGTVPVAGIRFSFPSVRMHSVFPLLQAQDYRDEEREVPMSLA